MSETEQEQPQAQPSEDEEAEEAEQEEAQPEGEPVAPVIHPPPETEPTPPQGLTPEEWDARWKKTDAAFKRYQAAIEREWQEEALDLLPFQLSPGAPIGFINKNDAGRVPDEITNAVMMFLGFPVEKDYEPDPNLPACDTCKGLGQVATGSQVPDWRTLQCTTCKGRGYLDRRPQGANGPPAETPALVPVGAPEEAPEPKDADEWGSPRLLDDGMPNPNFGKMPSYRDPRFP